MEFKVGDKVIVINKGNLYSTYPEMAETLNLKNWLRGSWIKNGMIGKVVATYKEFDTLFVGVSNLDNKEFIIASDGLKLISSNYIPKVPTHIVIWEEDEDPHRFFVSEKEANDFVKELVEKQEVNKESIVIVEIKKIQKVTVNKVIKRNKFVI